MATIQRFKDSEAWKASREVAKLVYDLTKAEPFCRDFALCNQMRRASISIVSNIAEGFERGGNKVVSSVPFSREGFLWRS